MYSDAIQLSKEEPTYYKIGNTSLPSVSTQNDLGILVTKNLSWTPHVDKICKSAYLAIYLIKRTFRHRPSQLNFNTYLLKPTTFNKHS